MAAFTLLYFRSKVILIFFESCLMIGRSTLVAHGAYDWAAHHDLHTIAKDDLITGDDLHWP